MLTKISTFLAVLVLAFVMSAPAYTNAQTTDTGGTGTTGTGGDMTTTSSPGMPATGANPLAMAVLISSGAVALAGAGALGLRLRQVTR
jgi:hypothetical protein